MSGAELSGGGSLPERRARDAAARRAAQTEFARPLVLEAGAGTGKTATLVARILAWCLGPGWRRAEEEAAAARLGPRSGARVPATGLTAPRGPGGDPEAGEDPEAVAARVLEGVVAITFTEAAAAEMAERVGEGLAALVAGKAVVGFDEEAFREAAAAAGRPLAPEAAAERARHLLAHLDRLSASTIHAYCRGLLAAHSLEAGVHPNFQVDAEGDLLDETLREVMGEQLESLYRREDALVLASAGVGPDLLAEAAGRLLSAGVPPEALERDPWSGPGGRGLLEEARRAAACLVEAGGAAAREALAAAGRNGKKGLEVLDAVELWRAAAGSEEGAAGSEGAGDARGRFVALAAAGRDLEPARDRIKDWSRGKWTGTESAVFGEGGTRAAAAACRDLLPLLDVIRALDPDFHDAARRTLAPILREVRDRFRRRGAVTFQELLSRARDLLRNHPEIRGLERRKIDQLLVDEFQDTDRLQCDLVADLALEGPEGQRPGLFLVGDPKQSIYGWRSADLAAYESFVDRVCRAGGRVETLSVNFRSVPAVLDEVERLLAPVMLPETGVQPPFEPLVPCPEKEDEEGCVTAGRRPVEHWISWLPEAEGDSGGEKAKTGPKTGAGAATLLEARAVARDLAALRREGGLEAWSDAALLLRATSDLEIYLRALQEEGVPYAVARDRSYYRRREVIDAAALVRAVLDPADHLALVTALRAPWVGVPDAALPRLWMRRLPELATELAGEDAAALERAEAMARTVADELRAGPSSPAQEIPGLAALAGWEESLLRFLRALGRLRSSFRTETAARFAEELRTCLEIEAVEAARFLGAWRQANLDRFFRDLAATLDEAGAVEDVLRYLRRSVAESREAQEGRPREAAVEAVQVMTIHKAKGLDFRHVYLAQLGKQSRGFGDARETRGERSAEAPGAEAPGGEVGDGWELMLLGSPAPGWWRVAERRDRVEAAERIRLFYVATTRAKERLVLAGNAGEREVEPHRASSFADLMPHRRPPPPALTPLLAELGEGGAHDRTDSDGVRWHFPALLPEPEKAEKGEEGEGFEILPDELLRAAAELAGRRRQAEVRQNRPFRAAASKEAHRILEELRAAAGEDSPELLADSSDASSADASSTDSFGGSGLEADASPALEVGEEGAGGTHGDAFSPVAAAVGTAVHLLLERFASDAEPAAELERLRSDVGGYLDGELRRPADRRRAGERVEEVLGAWREGPLWERFLAVRGHILARELPVLLPAPGPRQGSAGEEDPNAPVGYTVGTVDMVYRDPDDGSVVIVDYKTDAVADEADIELKAAGYRTQGRLYQQALRDALRLGEAPRFELWFLAAGRVVTSA